MIRIKTFYLVGRNTCKLALAPLALAFHSQKIKNKVREPWIYLVTPLPLRGSILGPRQISSLLPPAPPPRFRFLRLSWALWQAQHCLRAQGWMGDLFAPFLGTPKELSAGHQGVCCAVVRIWLSPRGSGDRGPRSPLTWCEQDQSRGVAAL